MNKRKFRQKVADILDAPSPAFSDACFLEFYSNTQVSVEGCRNILEYESDRIKLQCADLCVCFCGDGLFIRSMNEHSAIVCGTIASVDFSDS